MVAAAPGARETLLLAPVVGAYLIVSALGFLRNRVAIADFARALSASPVAMHALGAIAFFVGAGIVSFNRHWDTPAAIVVNLTGAWWAFEGAGLLASPALVAKAMQHPRYASTMRMMNEAALVIGIYLVLVGLGNLAA